MDIAQQETIFSLWDDLSNFQASEADSAARHLMESLCALCEAQDATWGGAIRMSGKTDGDPLEGWRVGAMTSLRAPAPADGGHFREILRHWDRREIDPSFLLPLRDVGTFRVYSFRRELPSEWFSSPFYEAFYGAAGIADSVFIGFPLNRDAESHFGFHSGRRFTDEEVALLAFALRGIKWFHSQLMLSHGLLMASAPLTATERRVMQYLLTDASEKQIAEYMGLAASTVHQHVVNLFRKFGVRSRAGLTSLWLRRAG